MPRRGELVGEAYILMRADGRLLKQDFRREARHAASSWSKEFDQEIARFEQQMQDRFRSSLAQAVVEQDFSKFRKQFSSTRETVDKLTLSMKRLRDANSITQQQFDAFTYSIGKWRKEADRDVILKMRDDMILLRKGAIKFRDVNLPVELRKMNYAFYQGSTGVDNFAKRLTFLTGRAFGKGSRNDFLNFIGSVVQGVSSVIRIPTIALRKVSEFSNAFQSLFKFFRASGSGTFAAAGRAFIGAFGGPQGIISSLILAAGAAWGFAYALPAVISGLVALAGTITLVVAPVVIGLAGALLTLVPLLPAVLAGFGLLGKAIYDYVQNKPDFGLEVFLQTINDASTKLQPRIGKIFETLVKGTQSLIEPLGIKVGRILDDFNKRLGSPANKPFFERWAEGILTITGRLGKAFNALFEGLLRFFTPVLPYAERLSRYLLLSFESFTKWAGSARGQNSIARWMDTAYEAAKSLWEILTLTGQILFEVFTTGTREGGQSFLDRVTTKLQEILDYLRTPEGKEALNKWFADAKQIGKDLWNIAGAIKNTIKYLDTPEGRKNAREFADALTSMAESVATIASYSDDVREILDWFTTPIATSPETTPEIEVPKGTPRGIAATAGEPRDTSLQGKLSEQALLAEYYIEDWITRTRAKIGEWSKETNQDITNTFKRWGVEFKLFAGRTRTSFEEGLAAIPGYLSGFFTSASSYVTIGMFAITSAFGVGGAEAALSFLRGISMLPSNMTTILGSLPSIITIAMASAIAAINVWATNIASSISSPYLDGVKAAVAAVQALPGGISSILLRIPFFITVALSGVFAALVGPFQSAYTSIVAIINGIEQRIRNFLGTRASSFLLGDPIVIEPDSQRSTFSGAGPETQTNPLARGAQPIATSASYTDPFTAGLRVTSPAPQIPKTIGGAQSGTVVQPGAVQITTAATSPNVVGSIVLDGIADALSAAV
jgi:hypothetical protein